MHGALLKPKIKIASALEEARIKSYWIDLSLLTAKPRAPLPVSLLSWIERLTNSSAVRRMVDDRDN